MFEWMRYVARRPGFFGHCVFDNHGFNHYFLNNQEFGEHNQLEVCSSEMLGQKKTKSQLHNSAPTQFEASQLSSFAWDSIDLMVEVKNRTIDLETASTTCGGDSDVGLSDMSNKMVESNSSIFRRGGVLPTGLCLSKAAIGAGVLSMSVHSAEVGILYQLGCLLVAGALAVVSIRMISIASIETQRWSFEDICEELFHPAIW